MDVGVGGGDVSGCGIKWYWWSQPNIGGWRGLGVGEGHDVVVEAGWLEKKGCRIYVQSSFTVSTRTAVVSQRYGPRSGFDLTQSVIMQVRMQNTTMIPAIVINGQYYHS